MTEQSTASTAFRLAEAMSFAFPGNPGIDKAAAELIRLQVENDLLASAADKLRMSHSAERMELLSQRDQATAQRDAFKEALIHVLRYVSPVADGAIKSSAELRHLHAKNADLEEAVRILSTVVSERDRMEAQRDQLLGALKKAVEDGCANAYAHEGDVCGERGCCGVVSYAPHADDCWVTTALDAIRSVEEKA